MKTTLELPDELFEKAEAAADRREITLAALFMKAIESEIRPTSADGAPSDFETDAEGLPIPPRITEAAEVKDDFVTRLRLLGGGSSRPANWLTIKPVLEISGMIINASIYVIGLIAINIYALRPWQNTHQNVMGAVGLACVLWAFWHCAIRPFRDSYLKARE